MQTPKSTLRRRFLRSIWRFNRATTIDDRGREVLLFVGRLDKAALKETADFSRINLDEFYQVNAVGDLRRNQLLRRIALTLGGAVLLLCAAASWVFSFGQTLVLLLLLGGVGFLVMGAFAAVLGLPQVWEDEGMISIDARALLLRSGRCASCGYHLSGLSIADEEDECTVCPECGSAWHLRSYGGR